MLFILGVPFCRDAANAMQGPELQSVIRCVCAGIQVMQTSAAQPLITVATASHVNQLPSTAFRCKRDVSLSDSLRALAPAHP